MEIEGKNCAYLDNFRLIKTLGQGYHAKVKLAVNPVDQRYVALKIFKKTHEFEKNRESLTKEFQVMQGLNHPNLINLIAVLPEATYQKKNGQSYKTMAIVLEYAGAGELFEYVSNCGKFSDSISRTYFHQMMEGLSYLHNQQICHRDMKPENVLYDEDFTLKIADFGFATAIAGKNGDGLLSTILGTENYMCPEIHQKVKYSGESADIFAAGIILFILYTGHPPFMKADLKDPYYKQIATGKLSTFWKAHCRNKPGKDDFFPDDLKSLFNSLFAYNPDQRATMEEIKANSWFNKPQKSMDLIRQEFLQRQKIVEQELEKQRLEKEAQKQKQQGLVYAGVQKFRSAGEVDEQFSGLNSKYSNLDNQRTAKKSQITRMTDFLTVLDPEFLLKLILSKDSNFCKEATLHDSEYKIKCLSIDGNGTETKFVVQILDRENGYYQVDFRKDSGCGIEYFRCVEAIKDIVNEAQGLKSPLQQQNEEQTQSQTQQSEEVTA